MQHKNKKGVLKYFYKCCILAFILFSDYLLCPLLTHVSLDYSFIYTNNKIFVIYNIFFNM